MKLSTMGNTRRSIRHYLLNIYAFVFIVSVVALTIGFDLVGDHPDPGRVRALFLMGLALTIGLPCMGITIATIVLQGQLAELRRYLEDWRAERP